MKQAQSESARYVWSGHLWPRDATAPGVWKTNGANPAREVQGVGQSGRWSSIEICLSAAGIIWYLVTLPLRLIFLTIAWLGRLAAILLGFCLMVIGIALWASPLFYLGIPLFLVGLVSTLKCLR